MLVNMSNGLDPTNILNHPKLNRCFLVRRCRRDSAAMQRQTAVSKHLKSKHLLLLVFALRCWLARAGVGALCGFKRGDASEIKAYSKTVSVKMAQLIDTRLAHPRHTTNAILTIQE